MSDTVGALDTECGFQKATMQSVNAGHVVTGIAVEPQEPVPPLWDGRDVSQTLDAVLHKGQTMPEKNRFPAVLQPVTAFSSKDYGADATSDLAPTLRASGHADSHANGGSPPAVCYGITTEQTPKFNDDCALTLTRQSPSGGGQPQAVAYAIQERATAQNAASGPNGVGVRSDDAAYTLEARPVPQSVAYSVAQRGRDGGATAELGGDVAAALRASGGGGDKPHVLAASDVLPFDTTQITSPNNYSKPKAGDTGHPLASGAHPAAVCVTDPVTHTLKAEGFDASEDGTGRGQPIVCHGTQDPCVNEAGLAFAMGRNSGGENVVLAGQRVTMAVRRLMPVECERLQGFPDFWTLVPTGKHLKPAADGPRYKQLGNSMPTPVMFWIGSRIDRMVRGIGHNGGPALDDFAELLG